MKKLNNKKKLKKTEKGNEKKKLGIEDIEALIKGKKEELLRITQKKLFLEKKLAEKNEEFEKFKKEYKELQAQIKSIDDNCEKYSEHLKEEKNIIHKKSVFYNFQNVEEMKKLEKEKNKLKMLINEKHEETINRLMDSLEKQKLDLETIKNKNFEEINDLNESFNAKVKEIKKSFTNYLYQFEHKKKEEITEVIDEYNLMEKNRIVFLKNLYNDNVKEMDEIHKNLIEELKAYYVNLMKENIKKIKNLKTKINELDTNDKTAKSDLTLLHNESISISNEIKSLELKKNDLQKDLKFYSKDFLLYKNMELIYNECTIHIKNLQVLSTDTQEQIKEIENELHRLSKEINVEDFFDHVRKENEYLKKRIKELNLNLEDVNKELTTYLNTHNIKKKDIAKVKAGTEFIIKAYNKEVDNLLYTEKKIVKKMEQNKNIYEKKLKDLNIQ